jgi:hypothetical protein
MSTRLRKGRAAPYGRRWDSPDRSYGSARQRSVDPRSAPLSTDTVLDLQSSAGNRATTALIKRDTVDLPDVSLPDDYIFEKDRGQNKGDRAGGTDRGGVSAAAGARSVGRARRPVPERAVPLRVGNVTLEVGAGRDEATAFKGRAADAVTTGTVSNEWSNPNKEVDDPFGSESFDVEMTGVKVNVPKKKNFLARTVMRQKPDPVSVDYTIKVDASWGVKDGGKIDIASGSAPEITSANYKQIVKDLTPVMKEKSWRAPRSTYWSQEICERHEKFHSTDDKGWAEGAGKTLVTDYVNKQQVKASEAPAQVTEVLKKATQVMSR